MSSLQPFPCWAAPSVRIVAMPKVRGWNYSVRPKGRAAVTSYRLDRARDTARRYSRKITEIGPAAAFHRRARP
jgi:hypothetical protein